MSAGHIQDLLEFLVTLCIQIYEELLNRIF